MFKIFQTSKIQHYGTPQWFFDKLDSVFHFDLDFLANAQNAKCNNFYGENGYQCKIEAKPFSGGNVWCNPPYREMKKWIKIVKEYTREGIMRSGWVCVLTFAKTDTKWFQEYGFQAEYALFVRGRLKFELDGVPQNSAPQPSVVLFFRGAEAGEFPKAEVESLGLGRLVKCK